MGRRSRAADNVAARAAEMGIDPEHLLDFEAARRRTLTERLAIGVRTHKPVMDDAPSRAFNSMAEYRRWCNENLPAWLGYGSD